MDINSKTEALRVTGAATLVTIYGITLSEWAAIFTITYLCFQIVVLAPRAFEVVADWGAWARRKWDAWRR